MVWSSTISLAAAALQLSQLASAGPTWPSSYDELEDIMGMLRAIMGGDV